MKKMLRIVALIAMTISGTWAYTATSQDTQVLSSIYAKIDGFVSRNPNLKPLLMQKIGELKTTFSSNERVTWFVDEITNHYSPQPSAGSGGQTSSGGQAGSAGQSANTSSCKIFPANNAWNTDISNYPVNSNSANYIASIGSSKYLHPDFGANRDGGPFGIPYITVGKDTPLVAVKATWYPDESDQGNRPIPLTAPIEKGSDAHVITVDMDACMLYELYASKVVGNGWEAGSSAKFDMSSNALRPEKWTSADAAGLPIFAGLARYDEVAAGVINHALRFTVSRSQKGYIHPATHQAGSSTDASLPPMGLRLRLKADYDISGYHGQAKIILTALKKYGMIVADNGSDWFISGAPDARWNDDDLGQLKKVPGSAFEAVDSGPIVK